MRPSQSNVTHGFARVNDLRFHYAEVGEGPLLLLLHGFPESWWSWRHQLETLAQAGHRVIALDQRGYNETEQRGPYDIDTLASDACEIIRALGEQQADVVGHDWGGAVAWHLAAMRPACVRKLAVLGCPHPSQLVAALRKSRRQLARSWYILLFQLPWLPEQTLSRFGHSLLPTIYRRLATDRSHLAADEIEPFVDGLRKPGAAKAMIDWYRAAFRAAVRDRGRVPSYPVIEADTLLIWGENDFGHGYDDLVPGTERYAPKLRVEIIERCGHFMQAERPDRVNALLTEFLGSARAVSQPEMRFSVVLAAVGDNKISVIREIRAITGLNLTAVKDLVDAVPKTIVEGATRQEAEQIRDKLTGAGAVVEIG
ncbi:MAG TPA: ribosomal protein L7/L12 [Polyangia bacterium]|nr:ribosomal protein L7/L12 [Polyangia bacterium]